MGLTLLYLGSRGSLSNIASQFGMIIVTASRAYYMVCRALYDDRRLFVRFPSSASEWNKVVGGFKSIASFGRVAGAVGGTLIKRSRP